MLALDESRQRCLKLGALLPSEAKAGAVSGLIRLSHYRIGAVALGVVGSPQIASAYRAFTAMETQPRRVSRSRESAWASSR